MAEYKQPKSCPVPDTAGYPSKDVGMDDVLVKGKFPPGTKQKTYIKIRGCKIATKGTNFREATPKASDTGR